MKKLLVLLFATALLPGLVEIAPSNSIDHFDGSIIQTKNDGSRRMWIKDDNYAKTSGACTHRIVERSQPGIVSLISYNYSDKISGVANGFFVSNKGHLITNYHCLLGASFSKIQTFNDRKYTIKSIVSYDRLFDLIKVLVDIPQDCYKYLKITDVSQSLYEPLLVISGPLIPGKRVVEGRLSAILKTPNSGIIFQIEASIFAGYSGSPVIDMRGNVVGVVSFKPEGVNHFFAIPSKHILGLK